MIVKSQKDLFSGLMFTVVGVAFAVGARNYDLGETARMGPGYFPMLLGILLAILGCLITLKSFGDNEKPGERIGKLVWKPLLLIIGANLLFGAFLGGFPMIGLPPMGLIMSVCVLVLIASMAGETFRLREALMVAAVLATGSYLIFMKMLNLPFQAWPAFIG